jgi:RHS repeat-associated protein
VAVCYPVDRLLTPLPGTLLDAADNRTSLTYPDGKLVSYTYDDTNRMKTVTANWLAGFTEYFYDDAGRLDEAVLPASTGVVTDLDYDPADRLEAITHTRAGSPPTTISSFNYQLNPNGNRISLTDTSGVTSYEYDELDRLKEVTYPGPTTTVYGYDEAGNRLSRQVDADPATTYAYDATDQMTSLNGVPNTFDKNGNLTQLGIGESANFFHYDHENRLFRNGECRADVNNDGVVNIIDLSLVNSRFGHAEGVPEYDLQLDLNGDGVINILDVSIAANQFGKVCRSTGEDTGNARHWYNGDGLRAAQLTFPDGETRVETRSVWDVGAAIPVILEESSIQGETTETSVYVYGLGLIARTAGDGSDATYYLTDGLGSVRNLTDDTGAVTAGYEYDVFGALRSTPPSDANGFRFAGEQQDHQAARGLIYLRARHYDPELGRFLAQDPLPLIHRYAYVDNNPVNEIDPLGLVSCGRIARLCDAGTAAVGHGRGAVEKTWDHVSDPRNLANHTQTIGGIGMTLTCRTPPVSPHVSTACLVSIAVYTVGSAGKVYFAESKGAAACHAGTAAVGFYRLDGLIEKLVAFSSGYVDALCRPAPAHAPTVEPTDRSAPVLVSDKE